MSLSGNTLVVGDSPWAAAYVFAWNGTAWEQQARLEPQGARPVSVSGDTVLIGPEVYVRTGYQWTKETELSGDDTTPEDALGQTAILNGNEAILGAPAADGVMVNAGAVYVFSRSGAAWSQKQKLVPPASATKGGFGGLTSLAGSDLLVSNRYEHYYYQRTGSSWELHSTLGQGLDAESVAIDADTVFLGQGSHGRVRVLSRNGTSWTESALLTPTGANPASGFGSALSLRGTRAVIGAVRYGEPSGAYLFERAAGVWSQVARLQPELSTAASGFGFKIAMSDDLIAIGAHDDGVIEADAGAAFLFELVGGPCASGNDCAWGRCFDSVCCAHDCSGPCLSCAVPGNQGVCSTILSGVDPGGCDAPRTCSATVPGLCALEPGAPCSAPSECHSGFCVDGVCCDSPCDGACDRCDGATQEWSGKANGACVVAPEGYDGDPMCTAYACTGGSHYCIGDRCSTDGQCVSGFACNLDAGECEPELPLCDGDHTMVGPTKSLDCAPFRCRAEGCLESCSSRADCVNLATCTPEGRCIDDLSESSESSGGCGCRHSSPTSGTWGALALVLVRLARRRSRLRGNKTGEVAARDRNVMG